MADRYVDLYPDPVANQTAPYWRPGRGPQHIRPRALPPQNLDNFVVLKASGHAALARHWRLRPIRNRQHGRTRRRASSNAGKRGLRLSRARPARPGAPGERIAPARGARGQAKTLTGKAGNELEIPFDRVRSRTAEATQLAKKLAEVTSRCGRGIAALHEAAARVARIAEALADGEVDFASLMIDDLERDLRSSCAALDHVNEETE